MISSALAYTFLVYAIHTSVVVVVGYHLERKEHSHNRIPEQKAAYININSK